MTRRRPRSFVPVLEDTPKQDRRLCGSARAGAAGYPGGRRKGRAWVTSDFVPLLLMIVRRDQLGLDQWSRQGIRGTAGSGWSRRSGPAGRRPDGPPEDAGQPEAGVARVRSGGEQTGRQVGVSVLHLGPGSTWAAARSVAPHLWKPDRGPGPTSPPHLRASRHRSVQLTAAPHSLQSPTHCSAPPPHRPAAQPRFALRRTGRAQRAPGPARTSPSGAPHPRRNRTPGAPHPEASHPRGAPLPWRPGRAGPTRTKPSTDRAA